jgi:hypothetical protein
MIITGPRGEGSWRRQQVERQAGASIACVPVRELRRTVDWATPGGGVLLRVGEEKRLAGTTMISLSLVVDGCAGSPGVGWRGGSSATRRVDGMKKREGEVRERRRERKEKRVRMSRSEGSRQVKRPGEVGRG